MIHIGLSLPYTIRHRADPATPPGSSYYPDVAPVDLAAAGGSLRFPEGNWGPQTARAGLEENKALLAQSKQGLAFPGTGAPGAVFALLRLPADKRDGSYTRGIFGVSGNSSGRYRMFLNNPTAGTNVRNRFQFVLGGGSGSSIVDITSPPWTEDAALVVASGDATGLWQLDWYSLQDGRRYAGEPVKVPNLLPNTSSGIFNIGGTGSFTSFPANSRPSVGNIGEGYLWDGEIAALGMLGGIETAPDQWARIARGGRLRDILSIPHVRWIREFDGTAASLAPPAWAVNDRTAPSTIVSSGGAGIEGSLLRPGSDLRGAPEGEHITLDLLSPGMVHGLMPGETERSVPFSGRASGAVEIRIHEAATGRVVRDWTVIATPDAGGAWSGSLMLPESAGGWLFADVRLATMPGVIARCRSEFGVGYKFLMMGQSQTSVALTTETTRLDISAPMSASVARLVTVTRNKATLGAAARRPVMGRVGAGVQAFGDGVVAFHNQFRKLKPATPYLLIDEAVNGTSLSNLLNGAYDSATDRHWSDLTDKLDRWGNDVTAVLFNWLMNEQATASYAGVTEIMEDAFLPDHVGHRRHSLVSVLKPGWKLGILAGDRETRDRPDQVIARAARIDFGRRHDGTIGPMVSDYRIEDAGGAHPPTQSVNPAASLYGPAETLDHGSARFMQRMGVVALQAAGLLPEVRVHPHYAHPRIDQAGRILVDVIAVNGGTVHAPQPLALRSWYVREPGDPAFTATSARNATAVLNTTVSPPRVEITRDSGSWPPGTRVMRQDDSEKRETGDGAAEDAIHSGGLYETWASDPSGFGFPVTGGLDEAGIWTNIFDAEAASA
ncbi:hypothetical protein CDV52_09000 [Haematobacter missouriensis]|uniref:Uncharacterized protein n=1 Tax=Haematobacter missouriensis TaxID=366616 RepID=A0A212AR75_9RHOB|nr:hypothetical protein [Haematobacter missouriensis]OWJ84020.1 hypothetical protein CDV52_09000 [Haematobacter missouriensis]